jgi:hypothetical protein
MELKSQLSFAGAVNRQYDDKFANEGAKVGATMNIRKPVRFAVTTGAALSIQDVADQYSALVLDTQQHVGFQFSSKDLALSIEEFRSRYIKPAITALANQIDASGAALYYGIPSSVGTPGTQGTDLAFPLQAGQALDENGAPVDDLRSMILPPATNTAVVKAGLSLFNDQVELTKQYKRGRMGKGLGFSWAMDQNMPTHTTGIVDGTPALSANVADGASTLAINGITTASITGAYKKGDVITIGGVYAVNPQSKVSTGSLKQFVVTADTNASSNAIAALPISPAITFAGPYQNVSALPLSGALVKLFGAATNSGKVSPVGIAMHRDAFVLGMADLPLPGGIDMAARAVDPDAGLSVRIVRQYDINNDQFPCRVDVLYGWKLVYPELACRLQG